MNQKTYPNNFRLKKIKYWDSQYFEKKSTESAIYAFKSLEIKKFIHKFFKNSGLKVHNCKLNYTDESSLHIFISYYLTLKSVSLISKINKKQHIKLIKCKTQIKQKKKYVKIKKNIKNYIKYKAINYNKILNKTLKKQNHIKTKKIIKYEKESLKIRRLNILKFYKQYLNINKYKEIKKINTNIFLENFFKSLQIFVNKKIKIHLVLQQLNKNLKQSFNPEKFKLLNKNLVNLRKYNQNDFFKEGINTLFMCTIKKKSSNLLTEFIAVYLKKLKRHNFFIKFIKATLTTFINSSFSNLKGIKIKIKGRFNGAPRAKHKIITIGNGVPILTLNFDVCYSEETSYTPNGTFGVKVWMY